MQTIASLPVELLGAVFVALPDAASSACLRASCQRTVQAFAFAAQDEFLRDPTVLGGHVGAVVEVGSSKPGVDGDDAKGRALIRLPFAPTPYLFQEMVTAREDDEGSCPWIIARVAEWRTVPSSAPGTLRLRLVVDGRRCFELESAEWDFRAAIRELELGPCPSPTRRDAGEAPSASIASYELNFPNVARIDFGPLPTHVGTIGDGFLNGCNLLTSLDLSGWINVRAIGSFFIMRAKTLRTFRMVGWSALENTPDYFLNDCPALETFEFGEMPQLRTINANFVRGCGLLREVSIHGVSAVTTVKREFFGECPCLKTLDLRALTGVVTWDTKFPDKITVFRP